MRVFETDPLMADESSTESPLSHSIDNDALHLPGGRHFDVHDWTGDSYGPFLNLLNLGGLTKFMFLEVVAAGACLAAFILLAWSIKRRGFALGTIANILEAMLFFVRDSVAIPAIGKQDAAQFLPFLWSLFFFILVNNLLGMLPWLGSPTAALGCTGALALCSFLVVHVSGLRKLGVAAYAHAFVPTVPWWLYPMMLVLEVIGHLIRTIVLAVRLFINMVAGHTVLSVILGFIAAVQAGLMYFVVTPSVVFGVLMLSFLELFVAFLQAYVFTLLTAVYIGAAVHPQH